MSNKDIFQKRVAILSDRPVEDVQVYDNAPNNIRTHIMRTIMKMVAHISINIHTVFYDDESLYHVAIETLTGKPVNEKLKLIHEFLRESDQFVSDTHRQSIFINNPDENSIIIVTRLSDDFIIG